MKNEIVGADLIGIQVLYYRQWVSLNWYVSSRIEAGVAFNF